jgi:hypothetical protein
VRTRQKPDPHQAPIVGEKHQQSDPLPFPPTPLALALAQLSPLAQGIAIPVPLVPPLAPPQ